MDTISDKIKREGMEALEERLGHDNALRFLAIVRGQAIDVDTRPDRPKGEPPIEKKLAALAANVPHEEWERLPADLTEHLDHYVYGTPRE